MVALAVAIVLVIITQLVTPDQFVRDSMDAVPMRSALPALSVASLVGFGVGGGLPAFAMVKAWVLGIEGARWFLWSRPMCWRH